MGYAGSRALLSVALTLGILLCAAGPRVAAGSDKAKGGPGKAAPPSLEERTFNSARTDLPPCR